MRKPNEHVERPHPVTFAGFITDEAARWNHPPR